MKERYVAQGDSEKVAARRAFNRLLCETERDLIELAISTLNDNYGLGVHVVSPMYDGLLIIVQPGKGTIYFAPKISFCSIAGVAGPNGQCWDFAHFQRKYADATEIFYRYRAVMTQDVGLKEHLLPFFNYGE